MTEHKLEIQRLVKEAEEKLREAEAIADESGLEIDFGLAYGMGGTYVPMGHQGWSEDEQGRWVSSSENC